MKATGHHARAYYRNCVDNVNRKSRANSLVSRNHLHHVMSTDDAEMASYAEGETKREGKRVAVI